MTTEHHCERLDHAVEADDLPVSYHPVFREWGIDYTDGGSSFNTIQFCPWDGERLPGQLRDAWFDRLDELGLEPEDPRVPVEMRSDRWWKEAGL